MKKREEEPGMWFVDEELAGKPGMPARRDSVRRKRIFEKWKTKDFFINGKRIVKSHISSLPPETRLSLVTPLSSKEHEETHEIHRDELAALLPHTPEYNRKILYKYEQALTVTDGMVNFELMTFISSWNQKNPDNRLPAFSRIMAARKVVKEKGWPYLIGGYGKRGGQTKIKDEWIQYYWDLYADQNQLKMAKCYRQTKSYFCKTPEEATAFPSNDAFERLIEKRYGKEIIFYARSGQKKWEDKYGDYIERNYANLRAGACLVSDHAQLDAGELVERRDRYPWITSWLCMKTQKIQASYLHLEPPNGDHVLSSLYQAILVNGVPKYICIDNGKDYRMLGLAGGRNHRLEVGEAKIRSLCRALGIIPIFARPFNAKAKLIERVHLKIKEEFSRHCIGFRGGNIQERPEKLKTEVKRGLLMSHEELKAAYDDFVKNILNKLPNDGRILQGKSPDEAWNDENPAIVLPRKEALIILVARLDKPRTIRRNGIEDSKRGVFYWAEWMAGMKGQTIYIRRPTVESNEVWCFSEKDELIGSATVRKQIDAIVETDEGREMLSGAMDIIGHQKKTVKEKAKASRSVPLAERMENDRRYAKLTAPKGFEVAPEAKNVTMVTHVDKGIEDAKQDARTYVGDEVNDLWRLQVKRDKALVELDTMKNWAVESDRQFMKKKTEIARLEKELDSLNAQIETYRQARAGGVK
ncbi:MAG: Mu transposase C-terminal domain-containing protein [Syntrophales bacterium]|nr:Mu transposase C-terminal domain-containing protein [Syntrophales bacterium]